jgi:hypothetical protein
MLQFDRIFDFFTNNYCRGLTVLCTWQISFPMTTSFLLFIFLWLKAQALNKPINSQIHQSCLQYNQVINLKQGPILGYRPKNGVIVGLSAQKRGHSWVIGPKTGSELGYRPKNVHFYFYAVAKWYIRQMAHSPNGSFAKWYIRQMAHSPNGTHPFKSCLIKALAVIALLIVY